MKKKGPHRTSSNTPHNLTRMIDGLSGLLNRHLEHISQTEKGEHPEDPPLSTVLLFGKVLDLLQKISARIPQAPEEEMEDHVLRTELTQRLIGLKKQERARRTARSPRSQSP